MTPSPAVSPPYTPPHPKPMGALPSLLRVLRHGDGNLLELLPAEAYQFAVGNLGYSRRSTVLFNDPVLVQQILRDADGVFPKSDLMVNALEPLIGSSIFVTDGERWRRQRAMIDPAFSQLRIGLAFPAMQAAVADHIETLREHARAERSFSIDLAMSHLTADIICRTTFSTSLDSGVAHDVFEDFTEFERSVAQVDIFRLIFQPAWADVPQPASVLAACQRIRGHLGTLVDSHLAPGAQFNDIASAVIAARDDATDKPFTRDELIDQLGVFFLAGHETSASVLTWVFYLLAEQPHWAARLRNEVNAVVGDGVIGFEHTRKLPLVKAFFRETLRLYPPITFMPRVALEATTIGSRKLKRGALVMISPWTLHRHRDYWQSPHTFEPERFLAANEAQLHPGAYIPFGSGPHVCVGAGFAQTEAILIIASLVRAFDFQRADTEPVRPAARLTTRPAQQIQLHVTCRSQGLS